MDRHAISCDKVDGRPKREPSPEWQALAAATRKSYERVIDPEKGYIRRALKMELDRILLQAIDTPIMVKIRNKVAKRFGFWTGNYAVKVLSTMFKFCKLYGHMSANPAKEVPALVRPENLEPQNRPWADAEFKAMLAGARERGWDGIVLVLGLGQSLNVARTAIYECGLGNLSSYSMARF